MSGTDPVNAFTATRSRTTADVVIITVAGEVDLATADGLTAAVTAALAPPVSPRQRP